MKIFTQKLWTTEEYNYDTKTDFIPTITGYIFETTKKKPTILVVPGGGYINVSPTEGEVVALKFLEKGYNAFILTYSTRTCLEQEPVKLQALKDISKAIVTLKENASKWNIDEEKICTIGFSAGGHLVSSLGVHHNKEFLNDIKKGYDIKPKAQILSYPVISTTEKYTHEGSKFALLGDDATEEEVLFMSTEKQVCEHTPPTFLWHCVDDEAVNYENSISFANNLGKKGVQFSLHVFPFGSHGVSTVDDLWVNTSYNMYSPNQELTRKLVEKKIKGEDINFIRSTLDYSQFKTVDEFCEFMIKGREFKDIHTKEYVYISKWVDLAIEWLEVIL